MTARCTTVFRILVTGFIGLGVTSSPVSGETKKDIDTQRLAAEMDKLAARASILVASNESRAFLADQFKAAPRKNVISMGTYVEAALQRSSGATEKGVRALAMHVSSVEAIMRSCGMAVPRVDLKIPVKAHIEAFTNSDTVYVLAAPLADEDKVKVLNAYSNGKSVQLSAKDAPGIPTLVITAAESESLERDYPLELSDQPGEEEKDARVVDDMVGIARIWIEDDHEGWWCGDPEIYVLVRRFRFSDFRVISDKVHLPGVNGEKVWHNIGDPNGTYRFVNTTNYAPVIQFQVWEEDTVGDDHVGTITVTWTSLPFFGYTTRVSGDVRIRVDRD